MENVTDTLFSLLCVKYILFWFYLSVGFEGNIKYAKKKLLLQPWIALKRPFSLSLCDKSFLPKVMVVNLFAILRVFLVGLATQLFFLTLQQLY